LSQGKKFLKEHNHIPQTTNSLFPKNMIAFSQGTHNKVPPTNTTISLTSTILKGWEFNTFVVIV
jgi:hypothetical protein